MAVKIFNCNLNGGDAVTANEDLTYRIYGSTDSYTTPIATKGSHNSDADVVVTGDVVVLSNVNVGVETSFKIASVDEVGNESALSDAYVEVLTFSLSNMTESPSGTFHQTSGSNWGGYAVSNEALVGDFEVTIDTDIASLNDCMIGISDSGVLRGFADAGDPWGAIIYNNNSAAFVGREESSAITLDNPTNNNFATGDKVVLKRVGTTITAIYRESGGDTLIHTYANTYSGNMYMHFSCYNNQYVVNPIKV